MNMNSREWKTFRYETEESLKIAIFQIGSNKVRSFLTALGVIIGIVSITMMGTAINGIDKGFEKSLSMIGYDVIYVQKTSWTSMGEWWRFRNRPELKTAYAEQINRIVSDNPKSLLALAVPQIATPKAKASYRDKLVEPVFTIGTNHNYPSTASGDLEAGRFFSQFEATASEPVCVIGSDIATQLFGRDYPVGKKISLKNRKFRVVGLFRKQGKFLGLFSFDNQIVLPLGAFESMYGKTAMVTIRVKIKDEERVSEAKQELTGLMRRIRRLPPGREDNFAINEQRAFKNQLDPIKNGIAIAGLFITGMSLFVGAIGIMNITFVSVRERTREIGLRKALGARRSTILYQFLIESVMICFVGGLTGLVTAFILTVVIDNILPDFPVLFSFDLVIASLFISVMTGIASGLVPAINASKLDPAESLRND